MFYESSDWHSNPDGLIPEAKDFIKLAKAVGARVIACGDLFNLLPMGRESFKGSMAVRELIEALDGYPMDYVSGNHDPYPWVRELFGEVPNIHIIRALDLEMNGRLYHFTHGHQYAIDWAILRHIAPGFIEFMVEHFPRAWYAFSKWMGWVPGQIKPRIEESYRESQRYNDATGIIWRNAIREAQRKNYCVVLGHTHTTAQLRRFIDTDVGIRTVMIDGGDLREGSFVIGGGGDVELAFL